MQEYESIADPEKISQGDVIEWVPPHRDSPWRVFGVIVTADCDLAWEKHGGVISYIPAMLTPEFVWNFWRPTFFEKPRTELLQTAVRRVNNWREKKTPGILAISEIALADWLRRTGTERMLDELGVTDKGERANLQPVLSNYLAVDGILSRDNPELDKLKLAYLAAKPQTSNYEEAIAKDVQKGWNNLPGDVFHLPSLPTGEEQGMFLLLRHIRQVSADSITARPDAVRSGLAMAKRVARVSAPYRYAITQNLARVFADIGLPDEHDTRCKSAARRFFETQGSK